MPNTTPRPQGQPQGNTPTQSTSTNQTLHLTPMLAKFKAGDSVLCPSVGSDVYTLAQHGDTVNFKHKVYFLDGQGEQQVFRPDGTEYKGGLPAIFHDTPANRGAISQLFKTTASIEAGDSVLCPHWGNDSYIAQQTDLPHLLEICRVDPHTNENKYFFFNIHGVNATFHDLPAAFHDTPANREAIATLYGVTYHTMPADTAKQGKGGV